MPVRHVSVRWSASQWAGVGSAEHECFTGSPGQCDTLPHHLLQNHGDQEPDVVTAPPPLDCDLHFRPNAPVCPQKCRYLEQTTSTLMYPGLQMKQKPALFNKMTQKSIHIFLRNYSLKDLNIYNMTVHGLYFVQ